MATINFIGQADPFDEPKELCMIIDAMHAAGREVVVNTRYSWADLVSGVVPGVLWVKTAMDKADRVNTYQGVTA